jgi:hypothetical protein
VPALALSGDLLRVAVAQVVAEQYVSGNPGGQLSEAGSQDREAMTAAFGAYADAVVPALAGHWTADR